MIIYISSIWININICINLRKNLKKIIETRNKYSSYCYIYIYISPLIIIKTILLI